jgi:hypothetical protein
MAPIDITFLIIIAIFGVIGIVRGYRRELGVTVILLVALELLLLLTQVFPGINTRIMTAIAGPNPVDQLTAQAILYTIFMLIVVFIAYQGETLTFPGTGESSLLGLGAGLLNGWLFAGTIWYYLHQANWPLLGGTVINTTAYSQFYLAMIKLLPPAVLPWWFVLALIAFLLLMRVVR